MSEEIGLSSRRAGDIPPVASSEWRLTSEGCHPEREDIAGIALLLASEQRCRAGDIPPVAEGGFATPLPPYLDVKAGVVTSFTG